MAVEDFVAAWRAFEEDPEAWLEGVFGAPWAGEPTPEIVRSTPPPTTSLDADELGL